MPLERGYHHWFTSDTNIVAQMQELGLGDRVQWIPSKTGWFDQGKIWNMVTPLDLMQLAHCHSLTACGSERRLAISTYLQGNKNDLYKYEKITAAEWWKKYTGQEPWNKVWGTDVFAANSARTRKMCRWSGTGIRLCCELVRAAA